MPPWTRIPSVRFLSDNWISYRQAHSLGVFWAQLDMTKAERHDNSIILGLDTRQMGVKCDIFLHLLQFMRSP